MPASNAGTAVLRSREKSRALRSVAWSRISTSPTPLLRLLGADQPLGQQETDRLPAW